MYKVEKVTTFRIRDSKDYSIIKDGLDELTANFMANALNDQSEKLNEQLKKVRLELDELRSVLPT